MSLKQKLLSGIFTKVTIQEMIYDLNDKNGMDHLSVFFDYLFCLFVIGVKFKRFFIRFYGFRYLV